VFDGHRWLSPFLGRAGAAVVNRGRNHALPLTAPSLRLRRCRDLKLTKTSTCDLP